jgi:S-DNA-T family DNA segregation ATPase FtsK/SpoIIIE
MAKPKAKKSTAKKSKGINLKDDRIPKVIGVISIMLAIYLTVAFVSYLYTWKVDQDKVLTFSWEVLFQKDLTVDNWLGRLGALVSNMFFYWGFGLPSAAIIVLLSKLGIDLLRKKPLKQFWALAKNVLVFMAFASICLEFIFRNSDFTWGGAFGQSTYIWLSSFIGQIGLFVLLVFSMFTYLIWKFNPNLENLEFSTPLGDLKMPSMEFLTNFKVNGNLDSDLDGVEDNNNNNKNISKNKAATAKVPENDDTSYVALRPSGQAQEAIPKTSDLSEKEGSSISDMEFELPETLGKKRPKVATSAKSDLEMEVHIPDGETSTETDPRALHPFDTVQVPKFQETTVPEQMIVDKEAPTDSIEPYDPTKDLSNYEYPKVDFLVDYGDQEGVIDRAELEGNKNQIIETLLNYKIEITKIRATIGPTVTLYEIVPAPGVKISKIKNLEDDIALSLAALGIRIIAPIPGKGTIGIEVPNKKSQIVSLREMLESDKFQNSKMALPIALGKTISNEIFIADLAKMPHLLIAGATGQGKSVGINTILCSLLYKKHPSQLKLILVDPKKVELFPYNSIDKHFLGMMENQVEPIITDTSKVVETVNSLCIEMDERYDLLKKARARNIKEYNEKFTSRKLNPANGHKFLPYIVLVIDEFADLIMTAGKEIEMPIARLAQLARAIGIHLVVATQRPSVNIITGIIKANFPARLAFKVTSKIDSRTILDAGGADQLIGRGDMLLNVGSNIVRLQCAFVDTPEVEKVIDHISAQQGYPTPFYLPEFKGEEELGSEGSNLKFSDLDSKFEEAARLVVGSQNGSTSSIQRTMQLGYNRAGRIMDQMEKLGIVGPARGSKPREVSFYSMEEFDNYWENLKKNS